MAFAVELEVRAADATGEAVHQVLQDVAHGSMFAPRDSVRTEWPEDAAGSITASDIWTCDGCVSAVGSC
jgi:hypothetical protein